MQQFRYTTGKNATDSGEKPEQIVRSAFLYARTANRLTLSTISSEEWQNGLLLLRVCPYGRMIYFMGVLYIEKNLFLMFSRKEENHSFLIGMLYLFSPRSDHIP